MTGMADFWRRLRQRKLVQWALAYAAGAFALVQGVDIVAQQFGWPEGLQRGITLVLVLGFFATLVLAWYHGERGAQTISGAELLVLTLLLAVGGGLLWRFAGTPAAPVLAHSDPTVSASDPAAVAPPAKRSEEHTSELQSLMRISYAVFCLKKKKKTTNMTADSMRTDK